MNREQSIFGSIGINTFQARQDFFRGAMWGEYSEAKEKEIERRLKPFYDLMNNELISVARRSRDETNYEVTLQITAYDPTNDLKTTSTETFLLGFSGLQKLGGIIARNFDKNPSPIGIKLLSIQEKDTD